ncbi:MAG: bifunctional precorrin-2 dehydrogenase/sirohydrochlorin ferrochelatase [Gemmatimonadota bacterium]|nr:bifunctional precorrin-2 dehydrogenase/sirohydrochlorin ferrochelatase [Gemmatimonadota bacterium]
MSGYPVLLAGDALAALVVGGGAVAARKARALLECGARVRLIAPAICAAVDALTSATPRLTTERREYVVGDVGDALLVIAATSDATVNAAVASDARALGRLVNVAGAPVLGNFATVATHRAGTLVIGVSAGGVPSAAARIRDAIAERFDGRYGESVAALAGLRERILADRGADAWRATADALVGSDFCAAVESGVLAREVAAWP